MNKTPTVVVMATLTFVLGLGTAVAQDEEQGRQFFPVETRTCDYLDGKGPGDLDKAIDNWNNWMDKNETSDYFAVTVVPYYFGENSFDVGWLGSWPSGEAMGRGTDQWVTKGGDIAAEFFAVLSCDSHSNFATTELKSPGGEAPPDTIVLTFSDCNVTEGESFDDVMAGLDAWSAYQTERGYSNGMWMMFPAFGGGGAEFDFKIVEGYDNHTEVGKMYDMYGTGGDFAKHGELLGSLVECDESRVYNGTVRRRQSAE